MKVLIAPAEERIQPAAWPRKQPVVMDYWLMGASLCLLAIGLVMVASASVSIADKQLGEPFYYFKRQAVYALVGLLMAWGVLHVKTDFWEHVNPKLLITGVILLLLVLIAGKEVNGSLRWISLGVVNIQPSEFMKLFAVFYLAGYLDRRGDEVRTTVKGFLKPMMMLSVVGILLLLEPDFGSAVVIAMTALGMMFIGGVKVRQFAILFLLVAYTSPYRLARMTCFLNPWANPFDCGFQLTQSLIAFGRGEWFGVGLGGSIQKLFYLPEAHTDFLFAVLAEELGLVGGLAVIMLFAAVVWRAFTIGKSAFRVQQRFSGFLAYGIGLLIGLQAFINIGVNMGLLPTKGLTLPLMSYGGSSIVATCIACAVLLRIHHEVDSGDGGLRRHDA